MAVSGNVTTLSEDLSKSNALVSAMRQRSPPKRATVAKGRCVCEDVLRAFLRTTNKGSVCAAGTCPSSAARRCSSPSSLALS